MSVASEWIALALQWSVVKRGLTYALVVGTILILINHSDVIFQGSIPKDRLLRMGMTVVVPYLVSTFSSVGAMRHQRKQPSNS